MPTVGATTVRVRILVTDSAELVRPGIRDVFASERRFSVFGEIGPASDPVETCLRVSPDVVFLGLAEPSDGNPPELAALRQMLHADSFLSVIVLMGSETVEELLEVVREGARGVLLCDARAGRLIDAVDDVLAGGAALDPLLARGLFEYLVADAGFSGANSPRTRVAPAVLNVLSPREREVLHSLARGYRNKEIAAQLGVSVGTVKTHLRHIFRKLTVSDRTGAVLAALQLRLPEAA